MVPIILSGLAVITYALATAEAPFETCDLERWRELSHEKTVAGKFPNRLKREGARLTLTPDKGKPIVLEDRSEEGGPLTSFRVIAASPSWISVLEAGEGIRYQVISAKTGRKLALNGCPLWSPDAQSFVAMNDDLESGRTKAEASIWRCAEKSGSCARIWSQPSGKIGAAGARWVGPGVEIVLRRIQEGKEGAAEQEKLVRCVLSEASVRCKDLKPWSQIGQAGSVH